MCAKKNLTKRLLEDRQKKLDDFILLDCTLRDGGYYNAWDFNAALIQEYLEAMSTAEVDAVELGFRSLNTEGFKGACAYTSDEFLERLKLPSGLTIGVMVNGSELASPESQEEALQALFPLSAEKGCFSLVRIACHAHEFRNVLPAANWLKERGFTVGFNLMQVADKTESDVVGLAKEAACYPVDVLYFADSMGGMSPEQAGRIIEWVRQGWSGPMGIHTHDNMGLALQNTLRALDEGVSWVDSTVTGMGRGPGNARTEEMVIEMGERRGVSVNMIPLMRLIRNYFKPMQEHYGWGSNPYYYLAGKYGIHSSYIQEMMQDARYNDEDILAVIEHLKIEGGKKFSLNTLESARNFYSGEPRGTWIPAEVMEGRDVLIIGTGPSVKDHHTAIENYIQIHQPYVIALNTQQNIEQDLIDARAACHPVRLLADCHKHIKLPQPLITPASMLPQDVQKELTDKVIYDFGIAIDPNGFKFYPSHCILPASLVVSYALAIATGGLAQRILLVGLDGYSGDDPRTKEIDRLLKQYKQSSRSLEMISLTPTRYEITTQSIYAQETIQ